MKKSKKDIHVQTQKQADMQKTAPIFRQRHKTSTFTHIFTHTSTQTDRNTNTQKYVKGSKYTETNIRTITQTYPNTYQNTHTNKKISKYCYRRLTTYNKTNANKKYQRIICKIKQEYILKLYQKDKQNPKKE